MLYTLKNGSSVLVRPPREEDAARVVEVMAQVDRETRFLSREPEEFDYTPEAEAEVIRNVLASPDDVWFLPEYNGLVVGQCSAHLAGRRARYRHRGTLGFVLLKEYWGLGIGGRMMLECLNWCREKGLEQVELGVIKGNERAMRMYKSFGFEVVGEVPRFLKYADGTYASEYYMVKQL